MKEKLDMDGLVKAIVVTAELTGTDLSVAAAKVMAEDLSDFPFHQVMGALRKCRRGLSGRLTVEAVISRLDDGRPGPEEAWAMMPRDESASVVWTEEMAEAFGIANPLICEGDTIQARMAFIEAYKQRCELAREEKKPVKWTPSLGFGFDRRGRESVLLDAVRKGRLTAEHACKLLPQVDGSDAKEQLQLLVGSAEAESLLKRISMSNECESERV